MDLLNSVQEKYPEINQAAGQWLLQLPQNDLKRALAMAAEMAGLMLIRSSGVKLPAPSGTIVLGATREEEAQAVQRFIWGMAAGNGLDPKDAGSAISQLSTEDRKYIPEISGLEQAFLDLCELNQIQQQHRTFVASAAVIKLVLAGNQLKLLEGKMGLAMAMWHLTMGSKTIPYPTTHGRSAC
ncbi:MAG TPA: hypothetical protein VFE58_10955 [Tepidisphaeraceae bacterium]|jgi:hypothetical protein|nr:hypothetical protein [Tepidisphaeraceae bacterium]